MGLFSSIAKGVGGALGLGGGSRSKTTVTPKSDTKVNTTVNNVTDFKPLADALEVFTSTQAQTQLLNNVVEAERQKQINDQISDIFNRGFDLLKQGGSFLGAAIAIFIILRFITKGTK